MKHNPLLTIVAAVAGVVLTAAPAQADPNHAWTGKRAVSEQRPNDLFYNSYVGPNPSGTAAQMYVSPLPIPAHVGHTYTTYQPLMPHEYMYNHTRSYWTHHNGAGWTRTKVRYNTFGGGWQACKFGLYDDSFLSWLQRSASANRNVIVR